MKKNLTIIFVTYHSKKKLIRYLKQLKRNYNIIIIENSSNYKLKKDIKKLSNAKVIINKKIQVLVLVQTWVLVKLKQNMLYT